MAHYDTDTDGDVDSNDTKLWLAYNEQWQLVAAFENTTSTPKEEWVFHNAGASGFGDSSYIDDVILRDRNAETSNPNLEERRYFCQNWRHDVVAIVTDTGKMIEWDKYSSYGVAFGLPAGDTNSDGDWDSSDDAAIQLAAGIGGTYTLRGDADLDGDNDSADITHANSITGGYQTLAWNVLTSTGVLNYRGYAGYDLDRSAPELYHVRFRAMNNKLGRWTSRDPIDYDEEVDLHAYADDEPVFEPADLCAGTMCSTLMQIPPPPKGPKGIVVRIPCTSYARRRCAELCASYGEAVVGIVCYREYYGQSGAYHTHVFCDCQKTKQKPKQKRDPKSNTERCHKLRYRYKLVCSLPGCKPSMTCSQLLDGLLNRELCLSLRRQYTATCITKGLNPFHDADHEAHNKEVKASIENCKKLIRKKCDSPDDFSSYEREEMAVGPPTHWQ